VTVTAAEEAAPAGAPWRAPPDPRAALRAAGVADDAVIAAARLRDLSRSHALTLAELEDGSAYVIKGRSPEAHASGRSLAAELYVYRLASWLPGLAGIVAEAVWLDERREILVLAAAPSEHLLPAWALAPGFPGAAMCAELGRALAALHAATRGGVPVPATAACGIVALPDTAPEDRGVARDGGAWLVADAVAGDPVLAEALRRCGGLLAPACLVHGDVKWDNAILDPGPPAAVRLLDWELSGLGDPAWDVGAGLADTLSFGIRLRGTAAAPARAAAWVDPAARALLMTYAEVRDDLPGTFAEAVAGCWVARTIHLAIECAAATGDPDDPVVTGLLATARTGAASYDALADAVAEAIA
jgi:hypothetical protein